MRQSHILIKLYIQPTRPAVSWRKFKLQPYVALCFFVDEENTISQEQLIEEIFEKMWRFVNIVVQYNILPYVHFHALTPEILFLPLKHKIHILPPPCNILYFIPCHREYRGRGGTQIKMTGVFVILFRG